MKRATDPKGEKNEGKKKRKTHTQQKAEAASCNGEAEAWPAGLLVVCVLHYRQLSGVSLLAWKTLELCQRET